MKERLKRYKNQLVVETHQLLSFSPVFAKRTVNRKTGSDSVFFPGCSLMSLGSDAVMELYGILRKTDPDMELSGFCCAKPSRHIWNGARFEGRIDKIRKNHCGTIYTACPNCFKTLGDQGMNVVSIWPMIDRHFPPDMKDVYGGEKMMIHDPCTARKNAADHDAVRSIMDKLGIDVMEFENSRENTLCCGKINMTMALEPEKGMKILEKRVAQCSSPKVVSYCASCVHSFGMGGCEGIYVSELFLQKKKKPSWANRIRFVMKLPLLQD